MSTTELDTYLSNCSDSHYSVAGSLYETCVLFCNETNNREIYAVRGNAIADGATVKLSCYWAVALCFSHFGSD